MPTFQHPQASSRYESLDAWRGIACLMVVVFHATTFLFDADFRQASSAFRGALLVVEATLYHGVTMFFVISGYCIAAAVEASARRQTPMADYFWRRIRRIFPPFWVLFGATALVVALVHSLGAGRFFWEAFGGGFGQLKQPADLSGTQWLGNLTLTENWLPGLLGRAPRLLEGTGHAWTLAYEEQFYAVCGLLLIASRRRMDRFFAGALGLSLITFVVAASPVLRSKVAGLFLDGHWITFALGIAVYYDRVHAGPRQRWAVRGVLVALLGLGLINPRGASSLIISTTFALALIGLQRWDAIWAQARAPWPVWWCGTRCYSLYLVHWPITMPLTRVLYDAGVRSVWGTLLITLPICLTLSVLAAWAFHAAVERRFLNRPDAVSAARSARPVDMLQVAVGPASVLARPH